MVIDVCIDWHRQRLPACPKGMMTIGVPMHKGNMMRGHRPPIPNPQPDPGPLPDPAPIPSPEPTPIPEPLPPPFAYETREKIVPAGPDVESGEIGQEYWFHCATKQDGAGWLTPARFSIKSRAHQCILTGGVRLGLVLVIASIMFAACQPRKPTPLVSRGYSVNIPASSLMLIEYHSAVKLVLFEDAIAIQIARVGQSVG